jgi:hypothetical protein
MPAGSLDAAVSAFRRTLERLEATAEQVAEAGEAAEVAEPGLALDLGAELGERAALMAVAGQLWQHHLGPLLTAGDLQKMGGRSRQAVHDMVQRKRLLALPTSGRHLLFPAFQLDSAGRPHPAVPKVLALFADLAMSPFTIASWFRTPQPLLGGRSPAEYLAAGDDPSRVEQAARRTAAKLRR